MKTRFKSILNIFTLVALLVSLLGSAELVLPVQTVAAAASNTSSLSADDWVQIQALLPAPATPDTQSYLKASNTYPYDYFASSISLSGDTLVVGAYQEDSNASGVNGDQTNDLALQSGAVYVFTRNAGTWSQQAYLKASYPQAGDWFGYSVSVSGDTLVVGAYQEDSGIPFAEIDNSASQSGAVYVFTRNGTTWSQQDYLKASNIGANDNFGYAVSISGDTLVVGAPGEDSNAIGVNGDTSNNLASLSGAAYVFTRTTGVWSQQAYLKASNTEAGDEFGYVVSVSGDSIVVGADEEDSNATSVNGDQVNNSATESGAAYVFTRSGTIWSQQAYLKASNTETDDRFGSAMSLSGDTLVVGAPGEDSNAIGVNGSETDNSTLFSGAAYVFIRNGTIWSQQAYLKASNTNEYDSFGYAVSVSGDTIVVGAYGEASNSINVNGNDMDNSSGSSGAAYVFTRSGMNWSRPAYLKASNTDPNDFFGWAVSVSGDNLVVGADQEDSAAIGANGNGADNSAPSSGAAYVYSVTTIFATPIFVPPVFSDVPLTYWASSYIERLFNAGVTGGCGTGIYCPDSTVTRAQMAVFLLKGMHGSSFTPSAVGASTGFTDVSTDYWAAAWIKQLAAEGITGGCGNGNYCPDATVTRAQMAVFLLKAKHGSSYSPSAATGVFTDVPVGYWADKWIEQLASEGITGGCGGGNYCPDADVTRAQMAVFLVKAFNLP